MLERLETRVPPPVWMLLAVSLVWLVSRAGERLVPEGVGLVLGVIFVVLGVGVGATAVLGFGRAKTTIDPHHVTKANALVTGGIYRVTRNPMYLGLLSIVIGAGLYLGSLLAAVLGAVFLVAVLTRLQIIPEERALLKLFGAPYENFMNTVRRWI